MVLVEQLDIALATLSARFSALTSLKFSTFFVIFQPGR